MGQGPENSWERSVFGVLALPTNLLTLPTSFLTLPTNTIRVYGSYVREVQGLGVRHECILSLLGEGGGAREW